MRGMIPGMELRSGPATLRQDGARMGGRLVLSGRHLRFEPDGDGARRRPEVLETVDVKRIDRRWTKLLGFLPVAPNVMDVVMRNGQRFSFTVGGRKAWIEAISDAQAETPKG